MTAGQRVRERHAARREIPLRPPGRSRSPVLEVFLWSRATVWAAAVFAFLWFEPNRNPLAARWDAPIMHELGYVTDVWARWDSRFFLEIARHGYGAVAGSEAFFPLYPGLVAGVGRVLADQYVLAGVLVSLAACLGAFALLYRLAEERLGADGARRAVLYLALFPMSLFLQAVYSESLFLLVSLAAFVLAERGRFLGAGLAAGLALLTRAAGVALLPSLLLLAWRSRERGRAFAGLAVAPLLFAVYPLLLRLGTGDAWGFAHAEGIWHRHLSQAGPLGGVWDGARAAWAGAEQLGAGANGHVYWAIDTTSSPLHVAAVNLEGFAFLCLFLLLTAVAWRRFGAPYGLYAALSLALPLSVPSERWPLLSLPRLGLVVFPFFLALAALGGRPRAHTVIVAVSSIVLGVAVVQWSLWQWVA